MSAGSRPPSALPAATLPEALRFVTSGDALRVTTAEDGTLLGRFQSFDGETLVLTLSGESDADIPLSAIRAVSRVRYSAGHGASFAALLGGLPLLLLLCYWLADGSPGGDIVGGIVLVFGLVITAGLTLTGALIGGAVSRNEKLFRAPPPGD